MPMKFALILTLLASLAAARPPTIPYPPQPGQAIATRGLKCPLGVVQCCQWSGPATNPRVANIWDTLHIAHPDADSVVGVGCKPITSIKAEASAPCEPVCCAKNEKFGIGIGCGPIKA
ncbi:hypothetical protein BV22DRAFT_1041198 [Leucogyrophana mollusca]|uniref:Uncharacterized protein n=1 Tax=Leucogyrophana mollusca TaxID=85980 RepID=A0ACB8B1K0_9AGAM|nr:hypothetical protein BV22DRAFT_1041198 [Leucogyrophana mollusca]